MMHKSHIALTKTTPKSPWKAIIAKAKKLHQKRRTRLLPFHGQSTLHEFGSKRRVYSMNRPRTRKLLPIARAWWWTTADRTLGEELR